MTLNGFQNGIFQTPNKQVITGTPTNLSETSIINLWYYCTMW